jgi:WD repeat-containing protein 48
VKATGADRDPLRLVRDIVSKPVKALSTSDFPAVQFPSGTTIFFSESSAEAGQFEVTYRGQVDGIISDVPTLELAAPHWLLSLLLQGEAVQKDPVKLSFILSPWKDPALPADGLSSFGIAAQPMPELPSG